MFRTLIRRTTLVWAMLFIQKPIFSRFLRFFTIFEVKYLPGIGQRHSDIYMVRISEKNSTGCDIYFVIPDWLIFDQSGSRKMAGFLKNLIAGKWSALSIYPNVFFSFFTLGLVAQIALTWDTLISSHKHTVKGFVWYWISPF